MSRFCWPACIPATRGFFELLLDRLEYDTADVSFPAGTLWLTPRRGLRLKKCWPRFPRKTPSFGAKSRSPWNSSTRPPEPYQPEPFDIFREYPKRDLPAFDLLTEAERLEMLKSEDPLIRAGAAHSFFNVELQPKQRAAWLELAKHPILSRGCAGRLGSRWRMRPKIGRSWMQ